MGLDSLSSMDSSLLYLTLAILRLFIYSTISSIVTNVKPLYKMFIQLQLCERDVFIGEEEEVGIPQMVEGRPYPLGGCSNVGNKKPKEDF